MRKYNEFSEQEKAEAKVKFSQMTKLCGDVYRDRCKIALWLPDDMEYFLRFEHPLYVIRDSWFENYGADNFCTDEIRHTLWELTDKREAETAYELDDDYLQEARNDQTMSM